MTQQARRCAIYTRKSTEEGLDQAFNSLDAQREACEAYIKSQAHEGWKLVKTAYDDGGFSGGSMERPAVQRLMSDMKQGLIDIIVVYKVDRLTRSLADFAKIVEILDGHGASFVSVTQQFNTTSSMGRLTLNVLLSFAQFEREVTGERIRDKIAASKRKGMWMGGTTPFGYDARDRQLVVNEAEAEIVRSMFRRYLELKCVRALAQDLRDRGVVSKVKVSRRGRRYGGQPFGRGALYHLLQNQVYLGMIVHKGAPHPGQHPAIVSQDLWDRAQEILSTNRVVRKRARTEESAHMLVGKLRDERGRPFAPVSTHKANGQRYRYYVSKGLVRGATAAAGSGTRISADAIEQLVAAQVAERCAASWDTMSPAERRQQVRAAVERVVVGSGEVEIGFAAGDVVTLRVRLALRAGGKTITPLEFGATKGGMPDRALVRAIVRTSHWRELLESGEARTAYDLARLEQCRVSYVQRHLPLAFLSPRLVDAILEGKQPAWCALSEFMDMPNGLSWANRPSVQ